MIRQSLFDRDLRDKRDSLWHCVSVPTLILDSHRLIETLKGRGFTIKQAEGISDALQEIDLSQLSTKTDVADLRSELRAVEIRILKWVIPLLLGQTALFAVIVEWLVA